MIHVSRLSIIVCLLAVTIGTCGCANSSLKSLFKHESLAQPDSIPLLIWHESYETAVAESKSTGKPILADFTGSDWCHWCVKLKQDVFETETFRDWARDNVVLLELDYPKRSQQPADIKQQNAALAKRYDIQGYPTVLLLDATGNVLAKTGYEDNPHRWILEVQSQLGRQGSSYAASSDFN